MTLRRLRIVAVVGAAVLLGACSNGDAELTSEESVTTSQAASATTAAATTVVTSSTDEAVTTSTTQPVTSSSATTAKGCAELSQDFLDAGFVPTSADFDGDDELDVVGTASIDGTWFVIINFGRGGGDVVELVDADPFADVRVLGAADFGADGNQEVAVVIGGGAYTQQVTFIQTLGCEAVRMAFADSRPATFLAGASVGSFAGVFCGPDRIEQYDFYSVEAEGQPFYEGNATVYSVDGAIATADEEQPETVLLSPEELRSLSVLECFGLEL